MLKSKNRLQSTKFEQHLNNFNTISLEVIYATTTTTATLDTIYNHLLNLKNRTKQSTGPINSISIFISRITKTEKKFRNNKNFENIRLDKTVSEITGGKIKSRNPNSGGSFSECSSLRQITIPSSVTSIGDYAFNGCSLLTQITFEIPSSLNSIGESSFSGCSSLTQITFEIPSSVTSIGEFSFSGFSSLTQITTPSSVTSFGDYAFSGCSSLTQITTPSSVTSIGDYAFSGCSSLTQITILSSATSIGDSAFFECSSLTQITILLSF